jgi:hypothetical protein
MTMNYADYLYNARIVFLVVSPIHLSVGLMGVFWASLQLPPGRCALV